MFYKNNYCFPSMVQENNIYRFFSYSLNEKKKDRKKKLNDDNNILAPVSSRVLNTSQKKHQIPILGLELLRTFKIEAISLNAKNFILLKFCMCIFFLSCNFFRRNCRL